MDVISQRSLPCAQIFYLVPVIGICFNVFPVNNSFWFALAFTIYIVMIQVRQITGATAACRGDLSARASHLLP